MDLAEFSISTLFTFVKHSDANFYTSQGDTSQYLCREMIDHVESKKTRLSKHAVAILKHLKTLLKVEPLREMLLVSL